MMTNQTDDRLKKLLLEFQAQIEYMDEAQIPVDSKKGYFVDNPVSSTHTIVEDSICPFLKAFWDNSIKYGYPNEENYCFKPKKGRPVPLSHQEQVCITNQFFNCPIYKPAHVETKGIKFIQRIFKKNELVRE